MTEYSCVRINSDEKAGTFPLQNIIMDRERMKVRGRLLRGDMKGLWQIYCTPESPQPVEIDFNHFGILKQITSVTVCLLHHISPYKVIT